MHTRTKLGLKALESAQWFSRVGLKDTKTAMFLSSWEETKKYCDDVNVHNFGLAAFNQISATLRERVPERYKKWRDLVDELGPVINALVQPKIQDVVHKHSLPKPFFEDMVYGIVLRTCMELEYADVQPPGFYATLA